MTLPADVVAMAGRGAEWAAWVERLPGLVRGLVDEWGLVPDGAYRHGHCSLVLPVRAATSAGTSAGDAAVLKVGFPDEDSEHEHLALQHWHGDGAVQLLRADPRRRALLLERAGPDGLTTVDDLEACEIAASSYSRLHRAPLPQLRRLSGLLERWREQLASVPRGAPVPHRMVEHAASIARQLLDEPNTDARLPTGTSTTGRCSGPTASRGW